MVPPRNLAVAFPTNSIEATGHRQRVDKVKVCTMLLLSLPPLVLVDKSSSEFNAVTTPLSYCDCFFLTNYDNLLLSDEDSLRVAALRTTNHN